MYHFESLGSGESLEIELFSREIFLAFCGDYSRYTLYPIPWLPSAFAGKQSSYTTKYDPIDFDLYLLRPSDVEEGKTLSASTSM
jgi:hypothetical protein